MTGNTDLFDHRVPDAQVRPHLIEDGRELPRLVHGVLAQGLGDHRLRHLPLLDAVSLLTRPCVHLRNVSPKPVLRTQHESLHRLLGEQVLGGGSDENTLDRKSTRLNSSHSGESRMPSSA